MDEARRLSERVNEVLDSYLEFLPQLVVEISTRYVHKKLCAVSPAHLSDELGSLREVSVHVALNDVVVEILHFVALCKSFQTFLAHNLKNLVTIEAVPI